MGSVALGLGGGCADSGAETSPSGDTSVAEGRACGGGIAGVGAATCVGGAPWLDDTGGDAPSRRCWAPPLGYADDAVTKYRVGIE